MNIEDDLARIARQEERLRCPAFDASVAWELGIALRQAADRLGAGDYMAHGGSFPIRLAGPTCIGAVTVSGLPQREDHALVTRTLAEFLGARGEVAGLSG